MTQAYDTIGLGYARYRQPDPRIAAEIAAALGDAQRIVNIGAGSGSYEPDGRFVVGIEPSSIMIRQRLPTAGPSCRAMAEALPFGENAFDAAMAVLTVHHWSDAAAGLREMRRVAGGRVVILTFDPLGPYFWLADYIPAIVAMDQPRMPRLEMFQRALDRVIIKTVPIPHDCTDGFLGAYWRRPHAYLDPDVRAAISTFAKMEEPTDAFVQLRADLESGAWCARYGALLEQESLDMGYRLILAE